MKTKHEHIDHLSAQQVQDYVNGTLAGDEVHAIEKHLLECALCEEAVEGAEDYVGKGGFVADVDVLRNRLANRLSERRRFILPLRQLGIAASLAILLGIGSFLIWQLTGTGSTQDQIAADQPERKKEIKPATESATKKAVDTTVDTSSESIETEEIVSHEVLEDEVVLDVDPEEIAFQAELEEKELQSAAAGKMETSDGPAQLENRDQIDDESPEPVVKSDDKNEATKKMVDRFEIQEMADETREVQKMKKAKGSADVLSRRSKIRGSRVSASSSQPASVEKTSKNRTDSDFTRLSPEPVNGMKEFEKYIERELNYPESAKENKINGKVKISFLVTTAGKLVDFKVEKGLGYGCDEEAIRLLREGPKWLPATKKGQPLTEKKEISIRFK